MIVQAGPDRASNKPKIDEMPKNPSQTEGREGVDEINKVPKTSSLTEERGAFGSTPSIAKDRAPAFLAGDLRDKSPEARAARIAELREALNKIGDNPSGRAEAKRVTLLYKLKILCK